MPISVAEGNRREIESLAIRDENGKIIDYKNPRPEGTPAAEFFDALSFKGKEALINNDYARNTFYYGVNAEGLDWALENVDKIVTQKPPNNSDPYFEAKNYGRAPDEFGGFGGISDFLKSVAPIVLTSLAPGAGAAIGSALGGGAAAIALGNAIVGGVISEATGGDFKKGAVSSGVGSLLKTNVAPSVAEAVGGGTLGNVASGALTGGVSSAIKGGDLLSGAISGGIGGLTEPLSETDASFMAADATQLAKQGLSESQISDTLSAGYASTTAADVAAALATNKTPVAKIEKELDKLSETVGLTPVETTEPEFLAADALGIAEAAARDNNFANTGLENELLTGGVDIGAIEQNLTASGVDPLVAADVANEVALNPNISVGDLSKYIEDFYGKTVYDVKDLAFDPTEPPDTRPEGEILVDTTKEAMTPQPVVAPTPTTLPTGGLFSQPTMPQTAPEDPYNFGANIAFGNMYQNTSQ